MKHEILNVQEALQRGSRLPFAMLQTLSRVTLGRTPQTINEAELLEARFFSETEEIRLFLGDCALQAVHLTEEPEDHTLSETYRLENRQFGREVTIVRLLEADEDGQMHVTATRLTGWKEANDHG